LQLRWGTCFGYPETINPFRIYLYHRRKICGKVVKDYTQEDDDMTTINDGGPAFPRSAAFSNAERTACTEQDGMTLRDWFAGQALAGMGVECTSDEFCHSSVAECAYAYADAMLRAREVKP
jgi:hypothetical protein